MVAVVCLPQCRCGARRHRQLHHERADLSARKLLPGGVQHVEIPARCRTCRRSGFDGQRLDSEAVGGDRPASLRLPPVIDHRHLELLFGPAECFRVAAFSGEEERAEAREVIASDQFAFGILLADRAEGSRCREERAHIVLGDHPPERPRVGSADGLAFVENCRTAVQERPVHDVRVADDPADVGGRPVHLARPEVVDMAHRPLECHGMSAVVAHDSLRPAGRARRVQDVERIRRLHGHAVGRFGPRNCLVPVAVPGWIELGLERRPLENDAAFGLPLCPGDSRVEEGHVRDHSARLDPTRGRDDDLGFGIVDPVGELVRRETAEHHRVDRSEPGAREHCDHRLGNHRHVHDHPVAPLDTVRCESSGKARDPVEELPVGERRSRLRDRRVVDQRKLICPTSLDVTVQRVVTGVQATAGKPPIERRPRIVEHLPPRLDPVDRGCGLAPELLRGIQRAPIDLLELDHHASLPSARLNRGPPEPIAELESSQQSCRFG